MKGSFRNSERPTEGELRSASPRYTGDDSFPKLLGFAWWKRLLFLFVPPKRQRNRPTVSGWLLVLIAIGIGVAAYNTASNILFLVLSFVFALLIVNGFLSVVNFQKLQWELRLPSECRAGEPISASLLIRNGKVWYSSRAIWFVLRVGNEPIQRIFLRERIEAGREVSVDFSFQVQKRGIETVQVEGPESTFPFGFLRKQTGSFVTEDFLVWPALESRSSRIPLPRRTTLAGGAHQKVGSGTDLLHLRDYSKGDPLRQIHWKATARTGKLMVRQLADDGTGSFVLHVDCSETLWTNQALFEKFLSKVSSIAGSLFVQDRLSGYSFNREGVKSVRHLADLHDLNDKLALADLFTGHAGRGTSRGNLIRFLPTQDGNVGLELTG